MVRAPNPFDTRVGHAAQRLASGGGNCSSCTTCSSCVVSAIVVSAVSSRMVAGAPHTAPDTSHEATPVPDKRGLRMLIGALLPLSTLALVIAFAVLADGHARPWYLIPLLALFPLWTGLRFATRGNNRLGWKLALLILIGFPLALAGEMFLWIRGVFN